MRRHNMMLMPDENKTGEKNIFFSCLPAVYNDAISRVW